MFDIGKLVNEFSGALDSYQAGGAQPFEQESPIPPPNTLPGADSPAMKTPAMPTAYGQNRMRQMGMPGIFQAGEAVFDEYRRDKWADQNPGMAEIETAMTGMEFGRSPGQQAMSAIGTSMFGAKPIEQDEIQMGQGGAGAPMEAYQRRVAAGNTGSGASRLGQKGRQVGEAVANYYTGGMAGNFT
jgi:hypothetical protein